MGYANPDHGRGGAGDFWDYRDYVVHGVDAGEARKTRLSALGLTLTACDFRRRAGNRLLSPRWGYPPFVCVPTACAVGFILSPLRGFAHHWPADLLPRESSDECPVGANANSPAFERRGVDIRAGVSPVRLQPSLRDSFIVARSRR